MEKADYKLESGNGPLRHSLRGQTAKFLTKAIYTKRFTRPLHALSHSQWNVGTFSEKGGGSGCKSGYFSHKVNSSLEKAAMFTQDVVMFLTKVDKFSNKVGRILRKAGTFWGNADRFFGVAVKGRHRLPEQEKKSRRWRQS